MDLGRKPMLCEGLPARRPAPQPAPGRVRAAAGIAQGARQAGTAVARRPAKRSISGDATAANPSQLMGRPPIPAGASRADLSRSSQSTSGSAFRDHRSGGPSGSAFSGHRRSSAQTGQASRAAFHKLSPAAAHDALDDVVKRRHDFDQEKGAKVRLQPSATLRGVVGSHTGGGPHVTARDQDRGFDPKRNAAFAAKHKEAGADLAKQHPTDAPTDEPWEEKHRLPHNHAALRHPDEGVRHRAWKIKAQAVANSMGGSYDKDRATTKGRLSSAPATVRVLRHKKTGAFKMAITPHGREHAEVGDDHEVWHTALSEALCRSPLLSEDITKGARPGLSATPGYLSKLANRVKIVGQKLRSILPKSKRLQEPVGATSPPVIARRKPKPAKKAYDPRATQKINLPPGGAPSDADARGERLLQPNPKVPYATRKAVRGELGRALDYGKRTQPEAPTQAKTTQVMRVMSTPGSKSDRTRSVQRRAAFASKMTPKDRRQQTHVIPLEPNQTTISDKEKEDQAKAYRERELESKKKNPAAYYRRQMSPSPMRRTPQSTKKKPKKVQSSVAFGRTPLIQELVTPGGVFATGLRPGSPLRSHPRDARHIPNPPKKSATTTANTGHTANTGAYVPDKKTRERLAKHGGHKTKKHKKKHKKKKHERHHHVRDAITKELEAQPANPGGVGLGMAMLKRTRPQILGG